MKTPWRYLLAFGLVGALTATSCVIKSGPDDGEGGSNTSTGGKGSGGSSTGGTTSTGGSKATGGMSSTGGTSSTGGSKSTGGVTSTGGMANVVGCDGTDFKGTAPTSCTFMDVNLMDPDIGACLTCISKANTCCDKVKDCFRTDPDNQCGYGGLDGESEFLCYQDCLVTRAKAQGGVYDPDVDMGECAEACVTPMCKPQPIGTYTSSLIACMHLKCETECFVTPAM
jgi:hypothetical protein